MAGSGVAAAARLQRDDMTRSAMTTQGLFNHLGSGRVATRITRISQVVEIGGKSG